MSKQPEALRLADGLEKLVALVPVIFGKSDDDLKAAAELRRQHALIAELVGALEVASQFMSIASDWNIDEAEINGEMRSTYDWIEVVGAALAKAKEAA